MIEAKTLRALAKHNGYKPSSIFRMQPDEILSMLTEKYPDIKEWNDAKARATVEEITAGPAVIPPKETTVGSAEPVVESEKTDVKKKEPKKRTRRTKSQIAADAAATSTKTDEPKEADAAVERTAPTRKRKKKKTPASIEAVGSASSEEIAVLRELLTTLQEDVSNLTRMTDDLSMFMAWFHNVKVDPREPIEHLASIDWAACIEDQVKK